MPVQGEGRRRWLSAGCALALVCVCASPAAFGQASDSAAAPAGTQPKSNAAAASHKSTRATSRKSSRRKKASARGQQKIDPQRAQEIQEALIREHYLNGSAAGTWNQSSEDAMRRYQADHGWQSKTVPDARALIALGLGPSHDHLLNPDSAMTTEPVARAAALTPAPRSADAGVRTNTTPAAASTPGTASEHNSSGPQ